MKTLPFKSFLFRLFIVNLFFVSAISATQTNISGPTGSGQFGTTVTVLPNGNIVVTDPLYDITTPATVADVGAVYLYDGATLAPINTLTGTTANDQVGNGGIIVLSNGNYVVSSPGWNNNRGAATFGNAATGISGGTISSSNSLVGTITNDGIGSAGITALTNSNYVVSSPGWSVNQGAATFGNGTTGITGTISSGNSLIGSASDSVGNGGIKALSNGNYVVGSYDWNGSRGAATFGNGTTGISGIVSSSNSLVGSVANDKVGGTITTLTNGNYVVSNAGWSSNLGAATFGNGTIGISGTISSSNSLVGTIANDRIGFGGITALTNGNYVVNNFAWNGNVGAATFGNGTTGISGIVSSSNSLVGSVANDKVGGTTTALTNGNYVVGSPTWNGSRGAATFGNGTTGISGTVSSSNSLVGSVANNAVGNPITTLTNGNYVVRTAGQGGAATFGSGNTGISGIVSSSNSLVGSSSDSVGNCGITALTNGSYVVSSCYWSNNLGAATFGNGTTGISGMISSTNSLVGSNANDQIGLGRITPLTNGNYIVNSYAWNGSQGAATLGNGTTGITGAVSSSNSLVGSIAFDSVSYDVTVGLPNGNYVINSINWDNPSPALRNAGAVTFGNGTSGTVGLISTSNSVIGTVANGTNVFAFDQTRNRLVVGRRASNIVSILFFNLNVVADGNISDLATFGGTLPDALSTVIIPNGRTVMLNAKMNIGEVIVQCGGTLSGGSPAAYIVGSVRRDFCSASNDSFTYPLGDANSYSPLTVSNTSGTGSLTATVIGSFLPGLSSSATAVSRYWSLEGTGITTDLTFTYTDADVNGSESNYKLFKRKLNLNQQISSTINTTANTITATSISTFSDWGIGNAPLAPTAAAVSISGTVVAPQNLGLTNALVTLTDSNGNSRTVFTGKRGSFFFADVAGGETYIISVQSKRYRYVPQVVTATEDLSGLVFSPQ